MQGLKAELLRGFWYVAVPGARLKAGEMVVREMLGQQILVARGKDGKVFALNDMCPHRAMPLHYGVFDGETVQCAYHAWRFDKSGECIEIPSMTEGQQIDLGKIRCGAFACVERQGLVWVYFPRDNEAPSGVTAQPPEIPLFGEDAAQGVRRAAPSPARSIIPPIGLMDPAHVAYVHTSRWFRSKARVVKPKEKSFEPTGLGFKMKQHAIPPEQVMYRLLGKKVTADITYFLPGHRVERIYGERHQVVGITALTPVNDEETDVPPVLVCVTVVGEAVRADRQLFHPSLPQPGSRYRRETARRAVARAEDDAHQRLQHAGALVDAAEGRVGHRRQRGPRIRQPAEGNDAALEELSNGRRSHQRYPGA